MNWSVIITALIVIAIFGGPFYLISRKSGSKNDINENPDEFLKQEKLIKHHGKKD